MAYGTLVGHTFASLAEVIILASSTGSILRQKLKNVGCHISLRCSKSAWLFGRCGLQPKRITSRPHRITAMPPHFPEGCRTPLRRWQWVRAFSSRNETCFCGTIRAISGRNSAIYGASPATSGTKARLKESFFEPKIVLAIGSHLVVNFHSCFV